MTDELVTIEAEIPKDLYWTLKANGIFRDDLSREIKQMLAVRFFQDHRLSLGQAIRLAGLDRWSFIQLLSQHNISVIDMDEEELEKEFATVDKISRMLQASRVS